jgi:translation initiation factor IF-1
MAKKDLVQVSGVVEKILGGGRYQVRLDNGHNITAQLSGRMRRFHIKVISGDRVTCGVSPYDPSHGFITYREPPAGSAGRPAAPER